MNIIWQPTRFIGYVIEINPNDFPLKGLPVGATAKYPHPGCSTSLALKVRVEAEGISLHCFKCAAHHWVRAEGLSYRDRKVRLAEMAALATEKQRKGYELPADFSHTIPVQGLAWLGMGGWSEDLIVRHHVGWSDKLKRVVIPVQPQGYTARAVFPDQQPKYLEKAPAKSLWTSNTFNRPTTSLVLTEDILSAGRVGEFTEARALLGTDMNSIIPPPHVTLVGIWTDNDKAGKTARDNIRAKLQWMPMVTIVDIHSEADPKTYSRKDLLCILKSSLRCHGWETNGMR